MAKNTKTGVNNNNYDDKIVKKSLFMSKNLNKTMNYLTPNIKKIFI